MPQCQAYEGGICADGGLKVLVADSAQTGLIAHYDFDSERAADSSGHGNHAETAPSAGPGHGPTGAGAWFDGASAVMKVPHIPEMNSRDLTVSFWMYLLEDSTNSYRTILRKAGAVGDMTPALMLLPNERRLHVRVATTTSGVVGFDSTALVQLRRWTHVAFVLKGGAALSLYVNGVKDCAHARGSRRGDCPAGGATYAWDDGDVRFNNGPLYVGADPFMSGTAMFFDGLKVRGSAPRAAAPRTAPQRSARAVRGERRARWRAPCAVLAAHDGAAACARARPARRSTTRRCPSASCSSSRLTPSACRGAPSCGWAAPTARWRLSRRAAPSSTATTRASATSSWGAASPRRARWAGCAGPPTSGSSTRRCRTRPPA